MESEPTDAAYLLGKVISSGGVDSVPNPLSDDKTTKIDLLSIVSTVGGVRLLSSTCIAAPSFTIQGKSYTLPVDQFCSFAQIVGYLMVAASAVIAVRMVAS
jgi:hypothetical protein